MSSNKKISVVWDHFTDIGNFQGVCNVCKIKMSYKSSVTNLKKHLDRKHPTICVIRRNEVTQSSRAQVSVTGVGDACGSSNGNDNCSNGDGDGTSGTTNSTNRGEISNAGTSNSAPYNTQGPARRTYGHQAITDYMPKRRGNIEKKYIDEKVMQLFILDFQPFRMVEDRGFRDLMHLAFPNYVIPSRKYFANNLLPSLYETKRSELKLALQKDVKSVCITVDIWSTVANDSMMAMTAHYIPEESCELRYCLLDCVPLEEAHTARNLAKIIKQVSDEWQLSNKVLLGVSDNGSNIKNAIEKELGWKHFPCYTHTLNLAVTDALKAKDVDEIINKVKRFVRQFKQSNVAWQKLKKYQEQSGNTPRRLIQEVATRWNSKFYMLQRCVELQEPLNSAMINLSMEVLTSYEWQLCKELCIVLGPCEEVTRELSGEKYVTGSLVIPITMGLTQALTNLQAEDFMPAVDRVRQDIIGGIKNRFNNLSQSKTYTNCMFLDPRFKLYFENQATAEETKRRIIALVVQEQNKTLDQNTATAEDNNYATPIQSNSIKSIWQDYHNKMKNIQPDGTAQSRAIVEVQRYLDEKILSRQECPLKWWKTHRAIYPHLYQIAITKLNAMASSVPCERVFSAAGNILNERRARLGIRKLQQLIFLNQNM